MTKRYRFTTLEKKDNKFELHLHNNYTNEAIAMVLELKDFARMFESLEEYFERERADRTRDMNHITKKYFTISLTKAELDSIQKQLLEELEDMLNRIRKIFFIY